MNANFRPALPLLALLPLVGCGGGGGDDQAADASSTSAAAAAVDPTGTWNYFREATAACAGDEFQALPAEITQLADGTFEFALGQPGEEFRFPATLNDRQLTLAGSSTVGDTTLEIVRGALSIEPDGSRFGGDVETTRTVAGQAPCAITDRVRAFRPDATDESPIVGDWIWKLEALEADGDCSGQVGEVETLAVQILPRSAGAFSVVLQRAGNSFQVLASLEEGALLLSGADNTLPAEATGIIETLIVQSSTSLVADGDTVTGELSFSTRGSKQCLLRFAVEGRRAGDFQPTAQSLQPFMQDILIGQQVLAIDPANPTTTFELDSDLGHQGLDSASKLRGVSGVSVRGDFDAATQTTTNLQPSRLFYLRGDSFESFDLVLRKDLLGEIQLPERVETTRFVSPQDLRVFSRPSSGTTLLTFRLLGIEAGIVSVDADGEVVEDIDSILVGDIPLFDTLDPATGELTGVIVQDTAGFLLRVRPGERKLLSSGPATFPTRTEDGSVFFFTDTTDLSVYRSDTEAVEFVGSSFAAPVTTAARGNDFFALTHDGFNLVTLLQGSQSTLEAISAVPNATSDVDELDAALLPTPDQIVYQYQDLSGTRTHARFDPNDGLAGSFDLSIAAGYDLADAFLMGDVVYYQREFSPQALPALAMRSDGGATAEFEGSWLGELPAQSVTLGERPEPAGLFVRNGDLLQFVEAKSPFDVARTLGNAGLSSVLGSFTVETVPGAGTQLLLQMRGDVFFVDAEVENSLVPLTDSLNQLDTPLL